MTRRDTEIVTGVRAQLEAELGPERFELWFDACTRFEVEAESVCVVTDNQFRAERLRKTLFAELQTAVKQVGGASWNVSFRVDRRPNADTTVEVTGRSPVRTPAVSMTRQGKVSLTSAVAAEAQPVDDEQPPAIRLAQPWSQRLKRGRRFAKLDMLVRGRCNQMAVGAAELVIKSPGQINPLLVWGPTGAGKTHLLEGIWSEVRRQGGRRVIFLTSEQFTTYFLQALRGSGLPSFRQKYRAVDLLVIDDIQFFAGKQATITEFLHTINALLNDGGQVVVSADRGPSELESLGAEVQARLQGGLVCGVEPLDSATRRTLAVQLAVQRQLELSDEQFDRIAARSPGDARALTGMMNRLWAHQQADGQPVSKRTLEDVLDELFPRGEGMISLDDIQRAVCSEFGLEPDLLCSERRTRTVSHPRMLAMWLARKLTRAALTEIGDFFGRRSHSTVVSAQHKVESWVNSGAPISVAQAECDVRTVIRRLERRLHA